MNPEIWGPPYWFFLHSISLQYPMHPNAAMKKIYYDFFKNLPEFLPSHSYRLRKLMNVYPITPYLDNRELMIKYVHLLHNKINIQLDKPEVSLQKFYDDYYNLYNAKQSMITFGVTKKLIYSVLLLLFLILIYKIIM